MLALPFRVIFGEQMLYVVKLLQKCYCIMRSEICYIIDWGFHIIAMVLITTRGWENSSSYKAAALFYLIP
jgi:hypothetical protein